MKYQQFLKNHNTERSLLYTRLMALTCLIIMLSSALIARLVFLQINQFDTFSKKANNNQYKLEANAPKRGLIYDRNHVVLAENITAYRIVIDTQKGTNLAKHIEALGCGGYALIMLSSEIIFSYSIHSLSEKSFW